MTTRTTVKELLPAIGQQVNVRFESLTIACIVIDAKSAWGRERLLIKPVAGEGEQWIELGRLMAGSQEVAR